MKHDTTDRRRWIVYGTVQGVGFRWFAVQAARRLGLDGYARNLPDGTVEIEAAGPIEAMDRLLHTVQHGPPGATVSRTTQAPPTSAPLPSPFGIMR